MDRIGIRVDIISSCRTKSSTGLTDPEGKSVNGDSKKIVSVNLATLDNTTYAKSPSTGEIVSNQFEEMDINHFLPNKVTYLTREDWNTYPDRITDITPNEEMLTLLDGHSYTKPSDAHSISSFKYSQKYETPMLLSELVSVSYDDGEKWDKFIDQLTPSQLASLAGEKFGMTGIESLGCSLYFLLLSILHLCIKGGSMKINDESPIVPFLMMLIGSLITLSTLFYKSEKAERFLPILSAVCYGVALGRQLELVAYPIADKITGVNWFGGSFAVYFTFFVLIFVGTVTAIVALFFRQTEAEK